jgi:hypothetical protein
VPLGLVFGRRVGPRAGPRAIVGVATAREIEEGSWQPEKKP